MDQVSQKNFMLVIKHFRSEEFYEASPISPGDILLNSIHNTRTPMCEKEKVNLADNKYQMSTREMLEKSA